MGTVPTLPAWSTGSRITSTDIAAMADATTWLLDTRQLFYAEQTVAQTGWVTATFTPVTFTAEVFDRDGQHSTVTNTSRVTIGGTLGIYSVSGLFVPDMSGAGVSLARAHIGKNGTRIPGAFGSSNVSGTAFVSVTTATVLVEALLATDYIELFGYVSASAAPRGSAISSDVASSLTIKWEGSS